MSPAPRRRYLIIGAGAAGISACEAIRSLDSAGEISLVTDDPYGYYSRPGLAYYLNGEVGEDVLYPFSMKDYKNLNLSQVAAQVERIVPVEHRVDLSTRKSLVYDRLVIAAGAQASPLTVPGAQLQGVHKLDSMADTRTLLQSARRAKSAVVVGGGITALELVEGLRAQGLKVTFFLRGDRYWSNVLDEIESRIVEGRLNHEGVQLLFNTELAEVLGKNGKVVGVLTKDGRTIPCEILAFAIGVLPRKELAMNAGINCERGILADEYLRTSAPDVFAAGDVAQVFDSYSGQSVLDTLWGTARSQGYTAGLNMAGSSTRYEKSVPFNVTRLAGLTTTIIGTVGRGTDPSLSGIARGDSETWRLLPNAVIAENSVDVNRLRLVVGETRLLGAVVMGHQAMSIPLQELISLRAEITPVREALFHTNRIAEVLSTFWTQWRTNLAETKQ
jgi:NADPH-dependent 2,4-dienoyl-CoA reductase/sulfur reductase-like enzyme